VLRGTATSHGVCRVEALCGALPCLPWWSVDKIQAPTADGLLRLTLPKVEQARLRKIAINTLIKALPNRPSGRSPHLWERCNKPASRATTTASPATSAKDTRSEVASAIRPMAGGPTRKPK